MQDDHGLMVRPPGLPTNLSVRVRANQRVNDIRARLLAARVHTRQSVGELKREIIEQADWRSQFQARPAPFLVAAFCVGLLLARRP